MYGSQLCIEKQRILGWPADGCDLLEVARDIGSDDLEQAVRRTIFEAAGRAGPEVSWALLHVCHEYQLQPELRQCCSEIARDAGRGGTDAAMRNLPLGALNELLRSRCWIVDEEQQIVDLIDRWVMLHRARGQDDILAVSGGWDVRWGLLPRQKLESLALKQVVPNELVADCARWITMLREKREREKILQRLQSKQAEMPRRARHRKSVAVQRDNTGNFSMASAVSEGTRSVESEYRMHSMSTKSSSPDTGRAGKLRSQVSAARDGSSDVLDDEALRDRDLAEMALTDPGPLRLSEETIRWRRGPQVEADAVDRFVAGATVEGTERRLRRALRCWRASQSWEGEHVPISEEVDGTYATERSTFFGSRLCHHVYVDVPKLCFTHFESFATEYGRTVGRLRPPDRSNREAPSALSSSEVLTQLAPKRAQLIGSSPIRVGRHMFFARALLRWPDEAEEPSRPTAGEPGPGTPGASAAAAASEGDDFQQEKLLLPDLFARYVRFGAQAVKIHKAGEGHMGPGGPVPLSVIMALPMSPVSSAMKTPQARTKGRARWEDQEEPGKAAEEVPVPSPRGPPSEFNLVPEGTVKTALKGLSTHGNPCPGRVLDVFIAMVVDAEAHTLHFALDPVVSLAREPCVSFYTRRPAFDCWPMDDRLRDALQLGIYVPQECRYAFLLEVDSYGLANAVGMGGTVDIEVLPREAMMRSWWFGLTERAADPHPRCSDRGPDKWGKREELPDHRK